MSESAPSNAKVLFRIPEEDGSTFTESLWAINLGDNRYQLDNSPFFAYSVSWQDIVYAPYDEDEEAVTFQRVVSKSGNRTIRVKFDLPLAPGNPSDEVLQGLLRLGCSYEGMNARYVSVNIPPPVELEAVRQYLISVEAEWEHADPAYAELFPE